METPNCIEPDNHNGRLISFLIVSFVLLIFCKAEGQNTKMPESAFKGGSYDQTFSTVRIGLTQSVLIVPKKEFHFVVQHRFNEITSDARTFFGLDFAQTRLGLDYGIFNWLSGTFGMNLSAHIYELALKAAILKQKEDEIPLSVSWYVSALEFTNPQYGSGNNYEHDTFGGRLSYVNQLNIARNQGILSFQVSPLWLHINYEHSTAGPLDIFAVNMAGRVRLTEMLGIIGEYIPVATNEEFIQANPFSIGLDINTGKHQFQLIFSNNQATNEYTMLTNANSGHVYFGFNLTRVFNAANEQ